MKPAGYWEGIPWVMFIAWSVFGWDQTFTHFRSADPVIWVSILLGIAWLCWVIGVWRLIKLFS